MKKNIISLLLSAIIIAFTGAGALWLTDRFSLDQALIIGVSASLAGIAAPYLVKWIKSYMKLKQK